MNLARSERRRSHYESSASEKDAWFELDTELRMDAELASRWIVQLPDVQRQVVTARIWGELTFEQIAEVVDRFSATVFRLFHEALDTLRKKMDSPSVKLTATDRSLRDHS